MDMKASVREFLLKILISLLAVGVLVGIGYLLLMAFGITDVSEDGIRELVARSGALAPLLFIIISFLQVTLIPIPGAITITAGLMERLDHRLDAVLSDS